MAVDEPKRVLVVDDHVGVRLGLASLIDGEQPRLLTVATAGTPEEALRRAREQQPDLVVLDVDLAGEDGLALIPALRRCAPCEVVVLTSLSDPAVAAHARLLGAQACVQKTAPAADLLALLHGVPRRGALPQTAPAIHPQIGGGVLSRALGSNRP